jgi:hypothetical protein
LTARLPNLFVIGAMKSGTSSLCAGLSEHPEIFMSPVKEPMHFSRPENWSRGNETYLRLFREASNERYLAEGSTEYTKRPFRVGVAERIARFNTDARLIYVMREPFSRLVSQYRHQVARGRERQTIVDALAKSSDYLTNSHYAYQLQPYFQCFNRTSIYLDTFESFISAPDVFYCRLFTWLGIDPSFVPPNPGKPVNASPASVAVLEEASFQVRVWRHFRHTRTLRHLLPAPVRRWCTAQLPQSCLAVTSDEFARQLESARRLMQPVMAEWIEELKELTGRGFEEWVSRPAPGDAPDLGQQRSKIWLPEEINRVGAILPGRRLTSGSGPTS